MIRSALASALVSHTKEKMSKESAGYARGTKAEHCTLCERYQPRTHECSIVAGKVFGGMWCRYFEKAK